MKFTDDNDIFNFYQQNIPDKKYKTFISYKNDKMALYKCKPNFNKVISFSLWGTSVPYNYGLLENILLAPLLYPGWSIWVYYNDTILPDVKEQLTKFKHVKLIKMEDNNLVINTMWRFLPIFEPNVEIMISRDADARLSVKDRLAVLEWENSDKLLHIIRDHPVNRSKIMAGMFGIKGNKLKDLKWSYNKWTKGDIKWGHDQKYLSKVIYPKFENNEMLVHARYNKYEENAIDPPLIKSSYVKFIGQTSYTYYFCNEILKLEIKSGDKIRAIN